MWYIYARAHKHTRWRARTYHTLILSITSLPNKEVKKQKLLPIVAAKSATCSVCTVQIPQLQTFMFNHLRQALVDLKYHGGDRPDVSNKQTCIETESLRMLKAWVLISDQNRKQTRKSDIISTLVFWIYFNISNLSLTWFVYLKGSRRMCKWINKGIQLDRRFRK